ncbi:6796_t:CDS:2, partial [Funneliformis mosseae]
HQEIYCTVAFTLATTVKNQISSRIPSGNFRNVGTNLFANG